MDQQSDIDASGQYFTWPKVKKLGTQAASVCNFVASFGVIFAIVFFVSGQKDRETQEEASAWAALADPRPGISVARQIEYLSKDGWFRSKSTFDNIDLVPPDSKAGVSLNGLRLKDSSMNSVKIDGATLKDVQIERTVMSFITLSKTTLDKASIIDAEMFRADLSNSQFSNSTIDALLTGSNASDSIFESSKLRMRLPTSYVFNREGRDWDLHYSFNMKQSYFRDTAIEIPLDDRVQACGTVEMGKAEFYYSSFSTERNAEVLNDKCFLYMDRSWIIGSSISGNTAVRCAYCTIAYSDVQLDLGLLAHALMPVDGSSPIKMTGANMNNSTFYRSTISGNATGVSFENSKFLKVDMSQFKFHGSNISGAEFDSYNRPQLPEAEKPDDFLMIYWRGYGRPDRQLRDIDEAEFDRQLVEPETAEQIRIRYPTNGFKLAWAWRDRPPKGIPAGVSDPVLCDPALRNDDPSPDFDIQSIPDECKPEGWLDPDDHTMMRITP